MKYGLFGNLDKKVNKLYAGLNPKMAPHIFPDGKEQLKNFSNLWTKGNMSQ